MTTSKTSAQQAVLLLGGSFNPPHFGHVETLTASRNFLEKEHNFKIVGAYCVLTTDAYVQNKLKKEALQFSHRYQLCEATINDYFKTEVQAKETNESKESEKVWIFSSHAPCGSAAHYHNRVFEVTNVLGNILLKKRKRSKQTFTEIFWSNQQHKNITRIVVMGADKVLNKNGTPKWKQYMESASKGNRDYLTLCIGRKGFSDTVLDKYNQDVKQGVVSNKVFIYTDLNVRDVSSTQIREVLWTYFQSKKQAPDIADEKKSTENGSLPITQEYVQATLVPLMGLTALNYWMKSHKEMWHYLNFFIRISLKSMKKVITQKKKKNLIKKEKMFVFRSNVYLIDRNNTIKEREKHL
ncbi:hypothetical protein RFI_27966 [Reticulomyxa filosa]|uniref:Cytidyltransferase-like domain-containing protein n=1 Tax=Reticulomyxa filosa TaxID=46433 RepID=X6M7J4_RETFI|nr:hypothetical protein RFI_27966 [Reticulomyxa filosa]|eukprot:ETO09412.1 hypothetical protein RFI_27966 [Reticulomyxa filosa]